MSERFIICLGAQQFILRREKDGADEYVGAYPTLGGAMIAARIIDKRVPVKVQPGLPQ